MKKIHIFPILLMGSILSCSQEPVYDCEISINTTTITPTDTVNSPEIILRNTFINISEDSLISYILFNTYRETTKYDNGDIIIITKLCTCHQ